MECGFAAMAAAAAVVASSIEVQSDKSFMVRLYSVLVSLFWWYLLRFVVLEILEKARGICSIL